MHAGKQMLTLNSSIDLQKTNMLTVAARGPGENARRINGDGLGVIGVSPQSQTLVCHLFSLHFGLQVGG